MALLAASAALALTGCSGSSDGSSSSAMASDSASESMAGGDANLAITFLPKNLGNPYFDTSNAGGAEAIEEFGGTYEEVGPTEASPTAQVPFIQTAAQQGVGALVVSANDPEAICDALNEARDAGVKVVTFDSDTNPECRDEYGKSPSNLYEEPEACEQTVDGKNNPCMATGDAVNTTVTLEGDGVPFLLDTFTGEITPIAEYTRVDDGVEVTVELARDASTVIALADSRFATKLPVDTYVTGTTADTAVRDGSKIVIRTSEAGTYTTSLSNGREVSTEAKEAPAAVDLTSATWQLDAEDWQPANAYGTTGPDGTLTTKVPVSVELHGLKAWPDIEELEHASGIGTYTTTVTLPKKWAANNGSTSNGAVLELGQVTDSFTLQVNGHEVKIDQISARADIGDYLVAGENTIEVTVATTLNNRLYNLDSAVEGRGLIQNYGLVGPVVLTPYVQTTVWAGR